jgi:hypothetical protein
MESEKSSWLYYKFFVSEALRLQHDINSVAAYIKLRSLLIKLNTTYVEKTILLSLLLLIKNSVAWVRERTIPTERSPLAGEVSANICG